MRTINRRESPRIEIKLRCHVVAPPIWPRRPISTENISRNGLLVARHGEGSSLPLPSRGQILTIEIELPATHSFGQKCIHCQGSVSWTSEDPARVAMRVNYMDFRSFQNGLRLIDSMQPLADAWTA